MVPLRPPKRSSPRPERRARRDHEPYERIVSGLRTLLLLEERSKALDEALKAFKARVETGLADHGRRLVRPETILEIARPDGTVLRIGHDPGG